MSNILDTLLGQVNPDALQDQTVAKPSFEYKIPEAGVTVARLVGYIEMGKHPEFYKGKEKEHPADYAKLVFELLGPKYVNADDNGVKKGTLYFQDVKVKTDEKALYRKLFMKMRGGRDSIKHMAQMLGEGFVVKIVHNTVGEGKDQKTYANIMADGEWLVYPPIKEDPLTGEAEIIKVPSMTASPQLFLFNSPTKEQWDTIFIDGEYTVKDDKGQEVTKSKNFLQERIMSAKNFPGSPVEDMLSGLGDLDLIDDSNQTEDTPVDDKPAEPEVDTPSTPKEEPKEETAQSNSIDDIFGELGIKT